MEIELKLRFVHCLLCDVNFCPVALASQSEDEKLLNVFCKYLDLSTNDVESLYDERVGFPFCDTCRGETLMNLSDLDDKFLLIQKDISQLVNSVSLAVVAIINKNKQDKENEENSEEEEEEEEEGNSESFSTKAICKIRKNISKRCKPNVIVVDFRRHLKKRKLPLNFQEDEQLCKKYLERRQKGFINNSHLLNVKDEPNSPFPHPICEIDSDSDYEQQQQGQGRERQMYQSIISVVVPPKRKRKQQLYSKYDSEYDDYSYQEEPPKRNIKPKNNYVILVEEQNEKKPQKPKKSTTTTPTQNKSSTKGKSKGAKKEKNQSDNDDDDGDTDNNGDSDGEQSNLSSDYGAEDDSYTDSEDSEPERPPKKRVKVIVPKKGKGSLGPRNKQNYSRDYDRKMFDPVEEIEPGLFKRRRSGWSFRKDQNEEGEFFTCLAEGCHKTHKDYSVMVKHVSLLHMHDWKKCDKCKKKYRNQQMFEKHKCTPITRVYKNVSQGDGRWVYKSHGQSWPYHEVDRATTGGFSVQCDSCGRYERERAAMSSHILYKHVVENSFVCDTCGFRTNQPCKLRKHQLVHDETRVCICDYCGKSMKTEEALKKHVLKHERGPKSWKCECDKAFSHLSALKRHRKSANHPEPLDDQPPPLINPIICPKCQGSYVTHKTYEVHRTKCKGKKQFFCPICQRPSQARSALRVHMRLVHPHDYMNYPEGHHVKPREPELPPVLIVEAGTGTGNPPQE